MGNKEAAKTPIDFYGSKEGNDISILLESRAVVEKRDFVATGVLTYAHGEIIEIELPQASNFNLKETVKLILYTKSGMFVFESTVVAKADGSLIVLNPPENRRRFVDKREHPRVEIKHKGVLHAITDRTGHKPLEQPIQLSVSNISLSGAGLVLDFDLNLMSGTHIALELDLGFQLACKSEVVRRNKTEGGVFYGIRFLSVSAESNHALRAFVLRSQIEGYFRQKRSIQQKSLLEERAAASG